MYAMNDKLMVYVKKVKIIILLTIKLIKFAKI